MPSDGPASSSARAVEIYTLFPRMVSGYLAESILGKAQQKGLLEVRVTDIRDFATTKHRVCDDTPYGGGAGMVMKVEPLVAALRATRERWPDVQVFLMSPRGERFDQPRARALADAPRPLALICGRYEGVDERVRDYVDGELSIGDFILTGGELAAMVIVDAVARLLPGVLGNEGSAGAESFEEGLLEYPQYTRPPEFEGKAVPAILQEGNHARIARWRRWHALKLTRERRPDLFDRLKLTKEDLKLLGRSEDEL